MTDNIHTVKPADILVLGDFNIDLLKPHSSWDSAITLLGLTRLVKSPTRVTQTAATLIDHIYTNNPDVITDVSVLDLSISDHCPISCSRSIKVSKGEPKTHSYISFRSFKHCNMHWADDQHMAFQRNYLHAFVITEGASLGCNKIRQSINRNPRLV